jgi:hypothetical protein
MIKLILILLAIYLALRWYRRHLERTPAARAALIETCLRVRAWFRRMLGDS